MKFIQLVAIAIFSFAGVFSFIITADAHRSGCHRWHSCPSDTGSYVCGDLGYTSGCGYVVSEPQPIIDPAPSIATKNFKILFHRSPEPLELNYWVIRYRYSPGMQNETVFRQEMKDFLDLGFSYGDDKADIYKPLGQVKMEQLAIRDIITSKDAPTIVEREFIKVYGRKPTVTESKYWKGRARSDKKLVSTLRGAMIFQKIKNISH